MRHAFHLRLVWLLLIVSGGLNGQSRFPLRRDLIWSKPDQEIVSTRFSPDGNFIALVTRVHWPDGHEAEGLADSFFKHLENRKRADPRFADPVIKLLSLSGEVVCEVQFGWNPSVSTDNHRIAFSEQVKPITGLRVLAETQAGNGIRVFDCSTKQTVKLADPDEGYLDYPLFTSDGKSTVYTINEAVNGAYGGSVGIGLFDSEQNRKSTLIGKQITAAVPCPPADSRKQGFESFMCSQPGIPSSSFSGLVFFIAPAGGEVIALVGTPIPTPGNAYMAEYYDIDLVSVQPKQRKILSLGKKDLRSLEDATFQVGSDGRVLLFSEYWRLYSLASGEPLPDPGPHNSLRRSVYSSDLKYYVCARPEDAPDHFVLYRTADGRKLVTFPKMASAFGVAWSSDSKRFALVGLQRRVGAMHYIEQLAVYSVPQR